MALIGGTLVAVGTSVEAGLVALLALNSVEPLVWSAHAWTDRPGNTPGAVGCNTALVKRVSGTVLEGINETGEVVDGSTIASDVEMIVRFLLDYKLVVLHCWAFELEVEEAAILSVSVNLNRVFICVEALDAHSDHMPSEPVFTIGPVVVGHVVVVLALIKPKAIVSLLGELHVVVIPIVTEVTIEVIWASGEVVVEDEA